MNTIISELGTLRCGTEDRTNACIDWEKRKLLSKGSGFVSLPQNWIYGLEMWGSVQRSWECCDGGFN